MDKQQPMMAEEKVTSCQTSHTIILSVLTLAQGCRGNHDATNHDATNHDAANHDAANHDAAKPSPTDGCWQQEREELAL